MNGALFYIMRMLDETGYRILPLLLSMLWQSSLLLLPLAVFPRVFRVRSAPFWKYCWLAAIIAIPLIPLANMAAARLGVPRAQVEVIPQYAPHDTGETASGTVRSTSGGTPAASAATATAPKTQRGLRAYPIVRFPWVAAFLVYLLGAGYFSARYIVGRIQIRRWLISGRIVTDRVILRAFRDAQEKLRCNRRYIVIETDHINVPATVGEFHPVILLPGILARTLSEKELHAVAIHELSHIRHHDPLIFLIISALRSILFFNPLLWVASERIAGLAEQACDDTVVEIIGEPVLYAEMLMRVAENIRRGKLPAPQAAGFVFSRRALLRRVEMIVSADRQARPLLPKRLMPASAALLLLAFGVAVGFPLGKHRPGTDNDVRNDFRSAIMFRNIARAEMLLEREPSLASSDLRDGMTVVHFSVGYQAADILDLLIARGADVNIADDRGITPLHIAAQKNNRDITLALLRAGARINAKDQSGRSAADHAIRHDQLRQARLLIENGAEADIFISSAIGDKARVEDFLRRDPSSANRRGRFGQAPLHIAVYHDHGNLAELLISRGADVNVRDNDGETSLHLAAWNGHRAMASRLLQAGADVNAENAYGLPPLAWARERDYDSLSDILIDNGASGYSLSHNPRSTWKHYLADPYSEKALLAHLIASGEKRTVTFEFWRVAGIFQGSRNTGGPLHLVQIARQGGASAVIVFSETGDYLGNLMDKSIDMLIRESDFNLDTESLELVRRM